MTADTLLPPESDQRFDIGSTADSLDRMRGIYARHGDAYRVYAPGRESHTWVFNHPDDVKRILITNHRNYTTPASPMMPPTTAPRAAPRTPAPGVVPVAVVGGFAAAGDGGGFAGSYFDCATAHVRHSPSSFFCCAGDWPFAG
jgi:hypothetical protein